MYQNLRFFDSDSNQINLTYNIDEGYHEGNIYLPLVSTGLYETVTIYTLEEVSGSLGDIKFVTPIAEQAGNVQFKYEFEGGYSSSENIFLYSSQLQEGVPVIQKDAQQFQTLLSQSYSTGLTPDSLKITDTAKAIPLSATAALMSEKEEGFFIRTLNIYLLVDGVKTQQIAKIKIYGEVEAEDERLPVLLSNIGLTLNELDYYLFKDSDIKEGSPDYILLNQKRKELLLQASEIKPFIGTYKALLHAIDFFGYNNLTLKEYWLNVNQQSENFGKLKAVAVPNQKETGFLANKNGQNNLPSSNHKKTSRFSLVYRLNTPNGEYDQWDMPKVEEVMDFSPDEVLIKLYGLKNKLQRDFLPLQAKIVDITGEGDYFSQFNQNIWSNQQLIKNQDAGREFESVKTPADKALYVEDLRLVDYRLTGKGQDFNSITQSDREEIIESIESFYSNYSQLDLSTYNTIAGIPIGAPVILEVNGLEDSWDDANFTWMDAEDTGSHMLTWQNWWHRGVYEIEWVVSGPRYLETFRGSIENYIKFPITLPHAGNYSVEANLYDLYNVKSTKIKKDWIEVKNKNVEVYGLAQLATKKLNWSEYNYEWQKTGSSWEWSRENVLPVGDTIGTFNLTMDRANYIKDDKEGAEFSIVRRFLDTSQPSGFNETPGPYQWAELKTQTWADGPETTWKMTRVGADINSSFKIDVRQSQGYTNDYLVISQVNGKVQSSDVYLIQSAYPADSTDINAWLTIADELNNLDPTLHPILSKFNYNPLLLDSDNDPNTGTGPQGTDECFHILAVAKEPSRNYDFDNVQFVTPTGGNISNKVNFTSYNPDFEDTYIIREMADLHLLSHVTFSYDLTNMPGVTSQRWKLINNTLNKEDIYYNNQWLTYLFKHKGYYTVELELTDLNGNTNKVTKNILNII
jgi:hypothetical protein